MSDLMRCNVCFRQPGRETSRFSITNCGHVICEICLQKGKIGECRVCRSPCRTIALSNETHSDIKMLFMDMNLLCGKYSKMFSQIIEFQESHRRRLLAHYKGKIAKLEETLKELNKQLESYSMRASPCNRQPSSGTFMNTGSESNSWCSSFSLSSSQLPNPRSAEPLHLALSEPKKNPIVAGPTRLSLISPPKYGRIGSVSSQSNATGPSRPTVSTPTLSLHHHPSQSVSQSPSWELPRFSHTFPRTPVSSQSSADQQQILLGNILKRRH